MIESAITCTLALQSLRAGVFTGCGLDSLAHDLFGARDDTARRGRCDEDFTAALIEAVLMTRASFEARCEPATRTTGLANAFDLGEVTWLPSQHPGAWVKVGPVGSSSVAWAWGESGRVVKVEGEVTAEDRLALEKAWSL